VAEPRGFALTKIDATNPIDHPETAQLRALRAKARRGELSLSEYERARRLLSGAKSP
jgi:hypothetical protein